MKNIGLLLVLSLLFTPLLQSQILNSPKGSVYYPDTEALIDLVKDASDLVQQVGEIAFADFRQPGSKWRHDESYIFVIDPEGNMLVHADPSMEGKNQIDLKDINGKPIIRGLIDAAMTFSDKPEGWYHYQWHVPGGFNPRWKSSYVHMVIAPSGKNYILGSGMYNDRMEKEFVVDAVSNAVKEIENEGEAAFPLFYDPAGQFLVKDGYIFVIDMNGVELVNPPFPALEGRNIMDMKDTRGKYVTREMINVANQNGTGWVDYMWPKPGESVSTQKFTYVSKAKMGDKWVMVGSGVYLADAPKSMASTKKMTALNSRNLSAKLLPYSNGRVKKHFRISGKKVRNGTVTILISSSGQWRV